MGTRDKTRGARWLLDTLAGKGTAEYNIEEYKRSLGAEEAKVIAAVPEKGGSQDKCEHRQRGPHPRPIP